MPASPYPRTCAGVEMFHGVPLVFAQKSLKLTWRRLCPTRTPAKLAEFGRVRPQISRNGPIFCRVWAKLVDLGRTCPELGRSWPEVDRFWPVSARCRFQTGFATLGNTAGPARDIRFAFQNKDNGNY